MKYWVFNNKTQIFLKFERSGNRRFAGAFKDMAVHIMGGACVFSCNTEEEIREQEA